MAEIKFVLTLNENDAKLYLNEINRKTEISRCSLYPNCDKCTFKNYCPFYFFAKTEFLEWVKEELKAIEFVYGKKEEG